MQLSDQTGSDLRLLFQRAADEKLDAEAYRPLCEHLRVAKMYYDMDLGGDDRYRDQRSGQLVMAQEERDCMIVLFDSGEAGGDRCKYTYYYEGQEYVHAYIEFREGVSRKEQDPELLQFLADVIYLLASRRNMRLMLSFAEVTDALTGIPNLLSIERLYEQITARIPAQDMAVLRINLQNFKYINETAGAKGGDEAIIRYAHALLRLTKEGEETACRMGGDNFAVLIRRERLDEVVAQVNSVVLSDLESAPNQHFEISAWIGISLLSAGENKPFKIRLNEASIACDMGKHRLKQNVVVYSAEMAEVINRGRDILAMFRPAIRDREFHPFFQAKVDMRTGALVGFEALCRWIHDGRIIYPDQFIPVLDKEGLIPDLDMAVFTATCAAIRTWKDRRLTPPRISSNFSKKNLFLPDIEDKILQVIRDNGISVDDIEVEITETVKEVEAERLISFVQRLKENGVHISVDDFGTGYSSLSLIHSIDADVIKIDKSFVDQLPADGKSRVLIESIVNIADRLHMATVAEGVETAEQGRALLQIGCHIAQGYYYSRPVNFESATALMEKPPFCPI